MGRSRRSGGRARLAPRAGFTLLELVVAIALGAIVLLGARAMLAAIVAEAEAVDRATTVADRLANEERLLRGLLGQVEVGDAEAMPFEGTASTVTFTTWCGMPAGWTERCRARLVVEEDGSGDGHAIRAELAVDGRSETVTVRRSSDPLAFLYLQDARDGGWWVPTWAPGLQAPLALGVVSGRDTLVVRIGDRG